MRYVVIACVLVGLAAPARADGGYFVESVGGTVFRGGLRGYGAGGLRFQIGAGYRRGPWIVEILGGATMQGDGAGYDCYDAECAAPPRYVERDGELAFAGFDIKKQYRVLESRWRGLGVRFELHAGPRYYWGGRALHGYDGPGLNAGATIAGDIWVFGYTLDFGMDAMTLRIPIDTVSGTAPYIMIGGRMGWL